MHARGQGIPTPAATANRRVAWQRAGPILGRVGETTTAGPLSVHRERLRHDCRMPPRIGISGWNNPPALGMVPPVRRPGQRDTTAPVPILQP